MQNCSEKWAAAGRFILEDMGKSNCGQATMCERHDDQAAAGCFSGRRSWRNMSMGHDDAEHMLYHYTGIKRLTKNILNLIMNTICCKINRVGFAQNVRYL